MRYKLTISGNLARLDPWHPGLASGLSYNLRSWNPQEKAYDLVHQEMFMVDGTVGAFPVGFKSRVVEMLGRDLDIVDLRRVVTAPLVPDMSKIEPLRPGQPEALAALFTEERGVVVCATGWGKSFLIKQFCHALPSERIVVVSPGRSDVLALAERISQGAPHHMVGIVGADHNQPDRRVVVSTAKSILKAPLEEATIIVVDEAHACGENLLTSALSQVGECRMFGFTASPGMRSDGADLVLEALFGRTIAEVKYDEAVSLGNVAPIEVEMMVVDGFQVESRMDPVGKKRVCYWRNKKRNQVVAATANSFPDDESVLVMVETVEHGLHLRKLMPGFKFIYAGMSGDDLEYYRKMKLMGADEKPLPVKEKDAAAREFRDGTLRKVISTFVWKQAVDFPDLQVLVRADGGSAGIGSIQIPGRLSRVSEGKGSAVLVDFDDRFDMWARRRSMARVKTYKEQRWKVRTIST